MVNKFLYPNGGSETYIFRLGEELKKLGHEVQYFGMEHAGRIVGNRVGSYTCDMDFHGAGVRKLLYPFKIVYSVEARRKLRPVLEDFDPDVVHLNNFNFQLTPSVLYEIGYFEKKRGKKIRVVYTAHDYQLVCPNHLLLRPLEYKLCEECIRGSTLPCVHGRCIHGSRIKSLLGSLEGWLYRKLHTYRKLDRIICPSYFMKNKLACAPDLADRLVVIHNFVDKRMGTGEQVLPDSEKQASGNKYVLYFGRYCKEKGVETLLEACYNLPDIPFVFAGSGPLEEEVDAVKNIRNKGFLSGEELHRVIAGAAFTVFPSEWYENCPFSVMESQVCGTPLLASDLGGTGELIADGISGELFRAGNAEELAEKIRKLWSSPELTGRYAQGCAQVCEGFDTAEEYCRKLLEVYEGA